MSDDDWFERALREEDDAAESDSPAADSESEEEVDDGPEKEKDDGTQGRTGERTEVEEARERASDTRSAPGETTASDRTADSGDENPFGRDFATAFENAPDPEADRSSGIGGPNDPSRPGSGSDEDFGFGDFDGQQPGFGGGGEFEGEVGDDEADFDEEAFESDLERLDIGIEGLDSMILGGVPRRSLMVTVGSAGTGKTTFGLQFLNHGLENGESAVYITLEESHDRILDTAAEKGWDFEGYVDEDRLAVVDIDPIEMANSLDSIQNDLPDLIEEFGADRLVLDSVSLLEMMYERAPKRRSQVFGFTRALKNAGITTLLTSEASEGNPYTSRFGIVEYLADAVFVLQYVRESDFRETRLAIDIQKIRDANHSRATKPYELTESGISVYRQANIF